MSIWYKNNGDSKEGELLKKNFREDAIFGDHWDVLLNNVTG